MIKKIDKNQVRKSKHERIRNRANGKIFGTANQPRLNVYRSLNNIYAQIIDDEKGTTLVSASSRDKELVKELEGKTKKEVAFIVGKALAEKAKSKKIKAVVFDRAGYLYTGRVKELAEGARSAGLEF